MGESDILARRPLRTPLADRLCLLPGTAPPHGTAPLHPTDRGLVADPSHPQRPQRRAGRTRGTARDDSALQEPLPEARLPVHQVHGRLIQQVPGGAEHTARPLRTEDPVDAGRVLATGGTAQTVSGAVAVRVQYVVTAGAKQRELQRVLLGTIEQREEYAGAGAGTATRDREGG